ncbi:MAG: anaerobic ribonucleoside-triphosphate reductase activating protein [Spirochaetales bacterium]
MLRFGLEKTSLIDFPGFVSCVVFIRGCNLRCPYCHNPELVEGPEPDGMVDKEKILEFLRKRKAVLQGVCLSGGEPLLSLEGIGLLKEIRQLGYKTKVDTNGTLPDRLERIEADYVALDVKTSPDKYILLGGSPEIGRAVLESIRLLQKKGPPHEVRITVAPEIFEFADAQYLAPYLQETNQVVLTGLRLSHVLDPSYAGRIKPYPLSFLSEIKNFFLQKGIPTRIRGQSL